MLTGLCTVESFAKRHQQGGGTQRKKRIMYGSILKIFKLVLSRLIVSHPLGRRFMYDRLPRSRDPKNHPFDRVNGTETSGFVPFYLLSSSYSARDILRNVVYPYFGCQPNCLRLAIDQIFDVSKFVFYDFGCGMGRAILIASEFPFQRTVGIEISAALSAIATKNADLVSRRYPHRCPMSVINSDILDFRIGDEAAVIFMYNPFGSGIIKQIISEFERRISNGTDIIIIYENPVHFDLFDRSDCFTRCFGEQVRCPDDERPYATDDSEAIVIWRAAHMTAPVRGPDFEIVIAQAGWRAELQAPSLQTAR